MLPTARLYSFSILYNSMNDQDAFVSLIVKPLEPLTVRTELHEVALAEKRDRWYLGSGAIHDNVADDFSARSSNGGSSLGRLIDVTASYEVSQDATLVAYYGHFTGEDVAKRFYTDQQYVNFVSLELTINF